MTELLPEGNKVEAYLALEESVSVPSGKVWKVTLIVEEQMYVIPEGKTTAEASSIRPADNKSTKILEVTAHGGSTIKSGQFNEGGQIVGWEFDYSQ